MRRDSADDQSLVVVVRLSGAGAIALDQIDDRRWRVVLTTEDREFAADPMPIGMSGGDRPRTVHFARPGAVLLRDAGDSRRG